MSNRPEQEINTKIGLCLGSKNLLLAIFVNLCQRRIFFLIEGFYTGSVMQ